MHRRTGLGGAWRKSSRCATGESCVEVATLQDDVIAVRDSKNATASKIHFTMEPWSDFVCHLRVAGPVSPPGPRPGERG
ncbi:DUF397 domain-containing protein [Streptomyces sp. NPDC005573]|uniref:DUF397 domain-containing protein n=1 Tax=Streptomyces sp. NPDC005573 TaxID=3156890 RepID=UPI0033B9F337